MNRPLRILQVYRTFFPDTQGGAEETIRQIAVGITNLGCECRVFVPSPNPEPKEVTVSGVPVIRSKMQFEVASCGFALGSVREFREQVRWADVVHYHFPWPFADLLDWVVGVDKPKVVTYHSDVVRQKHLMKLYRPLMDWFLNSADRIVATSKQYAETSQTLSSLSEKLSVIPIGIDESNYAAPTSSLTAEVRGRYDTGYFFFVGMLRYYKGLHILLEACQHQSFRVVIAGDGPERKALEDQAKQLGLDNVEFIGRVSDEEKLALIDGCRAMVFPSHLRSEAFGVTLLEGLMRSKPLVCAEVGTGTSYVNKNGETGFVVPPNDPLALREAMLKLNDDAIAHAAGLTGRARYEALFTANKMAESYLGVYLQCLGSEHD